MKHFVVIVIASCWLGACVPPNGLGASFTNYDANDRSEQLKVRQNFARDKYVFW